ncbi:MAG: hypothetical protein AB8I08_19330 [Sandaracinaceae bacterium]
MRRALLALVMAMLFAVPSTASARDLFESEDGEFRLVLRSALKGSWLLTFPQDDPLLDEETGGAGLFRLRFDLSARLSEYLSANVAYEHRALASTGASGAALLPPNVPAPFRLAPVEDFIVDDPAYRHLHELDRAYVSLHLPFLELTAGRQAIGLGRGVLFSAVDIFAPFSPTEVDREWRRGVDAIHAELRIPDVSQLSADFIVAFGNVNDGDLDSFAMLGRVRAVLGDIDGSVMLGQRGDDTMVAGVLSATVGDAEVHGELAMFGTDGAGVDGGFFGTRGVVAKGLLGGSYQLDIHRGIRLVLEYHYSGFGVDNVGDDPSILFDDAFQARFARGDSQLLGRHALALVVSAELVDEVSAAVSYLQSPVDGSGLVAPTVTWVASDMFTLVVSGFLPWGGATEGGVPQSEYGSSPFTLFVQARLYD